jgi:uncharacterized protein YecE (DUF72 family)
VRTGIEWMTKLLVGTSGYNYRHWWDGVFYPRDLPQKRWLEFYSQFFDTVELNVSFYRLPNRTTFEGWYFRTPGNFTFSVKGSRFITHIKRLKDCQEPLETFFSHAHGLKEKLGVILWQLPPRFRLNLERLKGFCGLLSDIPSLTPVRHTFEFRDASWFCPEVYALLKEHTFSLCLAHSSALPSVERTTADFVYIRFHGGETLYGSNYSEGELRTWSKKIEGWLREGLDVYGYFNNDAFGFAVGNALALRGLLKDALMARIPRLRR